MIVPTIHELFKRYNDSDQEVPAFKDIDVETLAHAQQKVEHDLTRWQAVRRYKKVVFFLFVVVWTTCAVGYENQAGGMVVSIPQFREDFGHYYDGDYVLDASWQSAITGGPYGSLAIGYLASSWLADKIGRRRLIILATVFTIPWITVEFVATTIEVYFVGKFMNAFGLGALGAVVSTYISEVSPMALRGIATASMCLALTIGPFTCVLINNTTATYTTRMAYRGIFIPQWIFSITSLILAGFLPESPYWLLTKGRKKDALKELRRMFDHEADIQGQFALMHITVEEAKLISQQSGTYADAFKKPDLRRTLLCVFSMVMQCFSGLPFIGSYSTYYFQLAGYDTQESFQISCGAQALSISGVIASFFILDRYGRRPLLIGGMIACSILNLVVAITGMFTSNISAMKTSSAFMAMYNFMYNIGLGPVPYLCSNELPSVFLRAKTMSLSSFTNQVFSTMWAFVLPYMFNPDQANMGSKICFIFAGPSTLSIFAFYFWLPETKGRSFEDIDEMFAANIPARKWKNYKTQKEELAEKAFVDVKVDQPHFVENVAHEAKSSTHDEKLLV